MAVRVRVELDQRALEAVLRGPEVAAMLTKLAKRGGDIAESTQRLSNRKGDITVTPARKEGDSLRATFGSTSSFWHLEEFGSSNNPPYRTLTNALNRLGVG